MKLSRILAIVPAVALTACVTSSDMQKLNDRLTDIQDQVTELKRQVSSKEEVQQLGSKVTSQTDSLLKSNAQLTAKVGEIDDKLQNTQGTIEQTNYRVDRLAQQVTDLQRNVEQMRSAPAAGGPASGEPSAAGTPLTQTVNVGPGGDPMETYQAAYRDYQKGNFDLAMQGFREFLQNNPTSDLADNAAYWIGESLFSQKKYRDAIEQFDMVINTYPKSDKVPAALLKKGYGYIELGQKAQGVVQLQYVIHEHPTSREATLARQKLKSVGIETNP